MVFEGPLTSLRRVKDDVKEVGHGLECGVRTDGFSSWKDGDTVSPPTFWVLASPVCLAGLVAGVRCQHTVFSVGTSCNSMSSQLRQMKRDPVGMAD